eukprot:12939463-Alexandrium_andersonii.AAC.1
MSSSDPCARRQNEAVFAPLLIRLSFLSRWACRRSLAREPAVWGGVGGRLEGARAVFGSAVGHAAALLAGFLPA